MLGTRDAQDLISTLGSFNQWRVSPGSIVLEISMCHVGMEAPPRKGWAHHLEEVALAAAGKAAED